MRKSPSPFDLAEGTAYRHWRDAKRESRARRLEDLVVEIATPSAPSVAELGQIKRLCSRTNMAVYSGLSLDREGVRRLGEGVGLRRLDSTMLADEDAISPLQVVASGPRSRYIPYTDRAIGWHTDGYYNPPEEPVQGLILHCVAPSREGGANALADPDMAYIALREADPELIRALMAPDVLTIPGNAEDGYAPRPDRSGPVFSVAADGGLHMRYTDRARNIVWKDDPRVAAAVAVLRTFLQSDADCVFRHRLEAGQGLVCNNVLHTRTAFRDEGDQKRLLLRARYLDRVAAE